jgi:radical SAM superfamily enzyme YgiQ (UPF0313 family)
MITVSLYVIPFPGQCVKGEDTFLETVHPYVHKSPYTALIAGLKPRLVRKNVDINIRIIDMQTLKVEKEKYGELNYPKMTLEKFRVGCYFDEVKDYVKEDDIIGINANFTHSRRVAIDFAKYASKKNPTALIVFGGTDATHDPEYYLRNGGDVVVRGEAEITFELLIEAVYKKLSLSTLPNISYQENGSISHNPTNFLKKSYAFNVETMLPPDLGAVDLQTYTDTGEGPPNVKGINGPFISVETSRGCAQACTFCATPATKGSYRFMRIETIRKHFEYFREMGIHGLMFREDNVLSRIHRKSNGNYMYPNGRDELIEMFKLAREMRFAWEFPNGLEFGQFIHGNEIDYELIDLIFWHDYSSPRPAGCYRAGIPLENLTDESSKLFRKLKPLGQIKKIIAALAESGVNTLTFNVIIGRPQDDDMTLKLTYQRCLEIKELLKSINPNINIYFNVFNLSIFPGTVDYKKLQHLLAFDLEKDPEVITFYLACLNTKYFTALEMTQARGILSSILNGEQLIDKNDKVRCLTNPRFETLFC